MATEPVVLQQMDAGAHRPGDPRRRGRARRRHGHRQAAQGRDLPVPAGPGADRPPAGRLAGDLVARRGRRAAPDRPARSSPRPSIRLLRAAGPAPAALTADDRRAPPGPRCSRPWSRGRDLTADQTAWAMGEILAGEATPAQIAGFAVALRAKGETIDEVDGPGRRRCTTHATPLAVPGRVLDVVGTGGDRSMSVNISTMAAIVAAGAGAPVVKHGNRSASSQGRLAPTCSRRSASGSTCPPTGVARVGERGRHHLLLRGGVPPGAAARRRAPPRARRRAPPSTSSARSPTRPSRRRRRSAAPTPGWRR